MTTTNHDYVTQTGVVLGLILAVIVGLVLNGAGATGAVLWIPTIGALIVGVVLVVKSCPHCNQLIFRTSTKCSECTADLNIEKGEG